MILLWLLSMFVGLFVGYLLGFYAKNHAALDKCYRDGFSDGRGNLRDLNARIDALYDRVNADNEIFKNRLIETTRERIREIEEKVGVRLMP